MHYKLKLFPKVCQSLHCKNNKKELCNLAQFSVFPVLQPNLDCDKLLYEIIFLNYLIPFELVPIFIAATFQETFRILSGY